MSRRVLVAALGVLVAVGLAACFSTPGPGFGVGRNDDPDAATGGGVDAGPDAKVYMDAPTVYMDAPKQYYDAPPPCVVGKPGTTCNL